MDQSLSLPPLHTLQITHPDSKKKPRIYTQDEWEGKRGAFTELYLVEDLTLAKVRKIMAEEHNFYATEPQYKKRIKAWGLEKNLDKETASAVLRIEERRKREKGKSTKFNYKGQPISDDRMSNLRKRHNGQVDRTSFNLGLENQETGVGIPTGTPLNIDYFTPSPSGGGLESLEERAFGGNDIRVTEFYPPLGVVAPGVNNTKLESQSHNQQITHTHEKSISIHSSGDNDVFGLTGALWVSPGGKSIIGSWIRDDVVMSGMSPFSFRSPPQFSKSPMVLASCCGSPFDTTYSMFRHYEERHAQHNHNRGPNNKTLGRELLRAVEDGSEAMVSLLLERDIDISVQDQNGRTALHLAANKCHEGVVRLLLEKGIDISVQDKDGRTALHLAARQGHITVVYLLLSKGLKVSTRDKDGNTALHLAVGKSHEGVACLLLEKGTDPSVRGKHGRTALHFAAAHGRGGVVRLILEKAVDISAQDEYGCTALHFAAAQGHEEVAHLLLEKSVETSVQDRDGRTALHCVAARGHKEVARLLLEKAVDISVQDGYGYTALNLAAARGHRGVVHLLLEKAVDISVQDKDGRTALHFAAAHGHEEVAHLLLEKAVDISVQDKDGRTALHSAAAHGHEEVVRLLFEEAVENSLQDKYGCTALRLAILYGHKGVVHLLLEKGR